MRTETAVTFRGQPDGLAEGKGFKVGTAFSTYCRPISIHKERQSALSVLWD